ncbi:hypothetical protein [Fimbriiglobus ruber]|uniref:PEP-CTERM protein-sorting domain-containing protein n=1 Tax=Fimbriiglobus ruber TaxID=1908690 RepID=A0A225E6B8_9BACT|nr:hypothetical protein [Fimbriiglobus ruber]OWK43977.1 hypothetical protein FRUB_03576 [Fimbriiglobus ruber]
MFTKRVKVIAWFTAAGAVAVAPVIPVRAFYFKGWPGAGLSTPQALATPVVPPITLAPAPPAGIIAAPPNTDIDHSTGTPNTPGPPNGGGGTPNAPDSPNPPVEHPMPAPEPATLLSAAIGMSTLALVGRWARRRKQVV